MNFNLDNYARIKMNYTEYETTERSNKTDSSNICKTELFAEYNIETMHHHITCCIKRNVYKYAYVQ